MVQINNAITWMLYGAFTLIVAFESHKIILTFTPPFEYLKVVALTPVVKVGDQIELSYDYYRGRLCRTDVVRFIQRKKDNLVVLREEFIGGVGEIGKNNLVNKIQIPPSFVPGVYEVVTFSFLSCYEGQHTATHPRVPFEVIK